MGGRSVAIALPVLQGRVTPRQLQGGRFNRPNDVICHSNGCLYFTDPEKRRPYQERQIPGPAGEDNLWDGARVYCLAPDGGLSVLANSRARAVAGRAYNVRREHALLAIYPRDRLDAAGNMVGHSIFADLNGAASRASPTASRSTASGGFITLAGRHLGHRTGGQAHRRHPEAGAGRQLRVRWAGPADAVLLRALLRLHAARQGFRHSHPWYKRRGQ